MENSEAALDQLFGKATWTDADHALFLDLLKTDPSALQDYFGEAFIINLRQVNPTDPLHAELLLKRIHERIGITHKETGLPRIGITHKETGLPQIGITHKETEFPQIGIAPEETELPRIARRAPLNWIAAASIAVLAGLATWFGFLHPRANQPAVTIQKQVQDIHAPQANRATITLANGQKLFLDSASSGTLAVQGNMQLVKGAGGQITYSAAEKAATGSPMAYNTLYNPRGSKVITLTLGDGTQVWLNSESSLTYPVACTGNERKVNMTGEAYFEVAHNKDKPFTVSKGATSVQVLGTHFNVNSYDDEAVLRVTLLEGSVRVSNQTDHVIIKPGQQAAVTGTIQVLDDVNLEEVMAWKYGQFQFGDGADITTIMRQVSRWYDVDVDYQGNITEHIGGSIPRDVNVSQVFKMLEATGTVKFKIEGRKVTVMPAAP